MKTKRNFDELCPYCNVKIGHMYDIFSSKDYQTNFDLECPNCKKEFEVEVHTIPEFEFIPKKERAASAESQPAIIQQPK